MEIVKKKFLFIPQRFFVKLKIFYAIVKLLISSCSSFLRDYEDFMIWFFFVDKKKKLNAERIGFMEKLRAGNYIFGFLLNLNLKGIT